MDDGSDQRDDKDGQDEKVEGRIKTRVIGKILGRCVGHGEMLLLKLEISSHVWEVAALRHPKSSATGKFPWQDVDALASALSDPKPCVKLEQS
jgi:hypothetical protein